ncbi:sulfatase-like hydrolase/transferase [Palleronia caenipelagi]|uniref:sulfatase-like hydrolase/transferase n=1 Tax=Palleronia caenipelagi TaxID=2489174 RepID=UPI00163D837C|nr:sulfatase-like hydrolase/transferase [Palleronia caenipelagi]
MTQAKNILLISLDDAFAYWKYRSAFGQELKTPNLDRICAESTAFHSAYCQVPVCGPSRSSFMSGLSPHQLGIFDNYTSVFDVVRPEQMWPYRLKQQGYYCVAGGKVHHGYRPLPRHYHDVLYSRPPETFNIGPGRNAEFKKFGGLMRGEGTIDEKYDDRYYDAQSSRSAARFLESYDRPEPFYREVGFYHPHSPYRTPVRFKEMYDPEAFRQPEDWAGGYDHNAFADGFMRENLDNSSVALWQKSVRNYFSAFSHVDEHLGRVWDALKASRHADNTIVILLADHGYHPGDKNRFRKYTLWEEAAGVPVIVHDPSQTGGRVVEDPVALLDIGPTVLDYAGCPSLDHTAGRSIRPLVEGDRDTDRAVPTFFYGSAGIRWGKYRYIRYQDGSCQLYDLETDLWQLRDLSADTELRQKCHAKLIETCREYGMEICEEGTGPTGPNAFISGATGADVGHRSGDMGAISDGALPDTPPTPRFRRHFATQSNDGFMPLPESMRGVQLAADFKLPVERFSIAGNDRGNLFDFVGGHDRFLLDIDCGTGNDTIHGHLDRLHTRLHDGDNTVITGHTGAEIHGGAGRDHITTADGDNTIHGGAGDMVVQTGAGTDIVTAAAGKTHIHCGTGNTTVILSRGQSHVDITGGKVALTLRRTGLPQTITGYRSGTLDVSDLAVGGDLRLDRQADDTVVLTTATECITFVRSDADAIERAVSGNLAA